MSYDPVKLALNMNPIMTHIFQFVGFNDYLNYRCVSKGCKERIDTLFSALWIGYVKEATSQMATISFDVQKIEVHFSQTEISELNSLKETNFVIKSIAAVKINLLIKSVRYYCEGKIPPHIDEMLESKPLVQKFIKFAEKSLFFTKVVDFVIEKGFTKAINAERRHNFEIPLNNSFYRDLQKQIIYKQLELIWPRLRVATGMSKYIQLPAPRATYQEILLFFQTNAEVIENIKVVDLSNLGLTVMTNEIMYFLISHTMNFVVSKKSIVLSWHT